MELSIQNIFNNLIIESVSRSSVIDAIERRCKVNITYAGSDNTHTGKRTIEVYAFGMDHAGNLVVRAYQTFGDTKTVKPKWKMFRLDRINSWQPLNVFFNKPIQDRAAPGEIKNYNPNGDGKMATVYKQVKF